MDDRLAVIPYYLPIDDRLATAGQPNPFQFGLIKSAGYDLVINLALSTSPEALQDEHTVAKSAWLEYVHIPVVWDKPTLMDFEFFFQVMKRRKNQRCFIHCAKNMRASVFVYLWRRIEEQVPHDIAQQGISPIWVPNETWQAFLELVLNHYAIPQPDQGSTPST